MIAQGKRDRRRADVAARGDVTKSNPDPVHFTAKVTPPLTVSSLAYEESKHKDRLYAFYPQSSPAPSNLYSLGANSCASS